MSDDIQKINDAMDLDRTGDLFNSSIRRADAHNKNLYTDEDIKKQRLVVSLGNLHVKSANTKLSAVRMRGYQATVQELKKSVDRKIRNANKYGRNVG